MQTDITGHPLPTAMPALEHPELNEENLIREFRPRLLRTLMRLTNDPACAEDLAHDTLIIVLQKLRNNEIRDRSSLCSFVLNTGKFRYLGWARRHDNKVTLLESYEDLSGPGHDVGDRVFADELRTMVAAAIDRLSIARDRDILRRCYVDDQSKEEICEELRLSGDQYDRVISRARGRLRTEMSPESYAWS